MKTTYYRQVRNEISPKTMSERDKKLNYWTMRRFVQGYDAYWKDKSEELQKKTIDNLERIIFERKLEVYGDLDPSQK